jgi:hypothetical protein
MPTRKINVAKEKRNLNEENSRSHSQLMHTKLLFTFTGIFFVCLYGVTTSFITSPPTPSSRHPTRESQPETSLSLISTSFERNAHFERT